MHPGIPRLIKEGVIEDWFRGIARDKIAEKQGIGTGTVTGIVREWIGDFEDKGIVDAMRYFAVTFRKLKLTIPDCVLGARNVAMLNNIGIVRNDFEEFISETYKFLKELGVDPKKMASCIQQIEDLASTMPIAQIPQYIAELHAEKKQLLQELNELKSVELDLKVKVQTLKEEAVHLSEGYEQFTDIKLELKRYGLDIDTLPSFAKAVKEASEHRFDGHFIGSRLAYWDQFENNHLVLTESVAKLEREKENLEHRVGYLKKQRNYSTYD